MLFDPKVWHDTVVERWEDFQSGKLKGDESPIGLKKLRDANGNWSDKSQGPGFECPNCRCNRYTKCGCQKKAAVSDEPDQASNEE